MNLHPLTILTTTHFPLHLSFFAHIYSLPLPFSFHFLFVLYDIFHCQHVTLHTQLLSTITSHQPICWVLWWLNLTVLEPLIAVIADWNRFKASNIHFRVTLVSLETSLLMFHFSQWQRWYMLCTQGSESVVFPVFSWSNIEQHHEWTRAMMIAIPSCNYNSQWITSLYVFCNDIILARHNWQYVCKSSIRLNAFPPIFQAIQYIDCYKYTHACKYAGDNKTTWLVGSLVSAITHYTYIS